MKVICDELILNSAEYLKLIKSFLDKHSLNIDFEFFQAPLNLDINLSLLQADAIFIRSTTKITEGFLANSSCKFLASAVAGDDHLKNLDAIIGDKNIYLSKAQGSNANSVAEFTLAQIIYILNQQKYHPSNKIKKNKIKFLIVGYGHVGKLLRAKLELLARFLSLEIFIYDPCIEITKLDLNMSCVLNNLDDLGDFDFISLHASLTYPPKKNSSYQLFDLQKIKSSKDNAVLINNSRGLLVDEAAILKVQKHKNLYYFADCWHNEPNLNLDLVKGCVLGSPHIAGHSVDAKLAGTYKVFYDFTMFLSGYYQLNTDELLKSFTKINQAYLDQYSDKKIIEFSSENQQNSLITLADIVNKSHDFKQDFNSLKNAIFNTASQNFKNYFLNYRKTYSRFEFKNFTVKPTKDNSGILRGILQELGFKSE